jgi:hypothetical protein
LRKRDVLTIALLLSLNAILIGPAVLASEHVANGNFSAGFTSWQLPLPTGNPREGVLNHSWLRGEDQCLSLTIWSRRGLDYDSRTVSQKLNLEIGRGEWSISGFIDRAEVGAQCDVLAASVVVVLLDDAGNVRLVRYSHTIKGKLESTQTEGAVEVNRKFPFARSLSADMRSLWGSVVESWRIVALELRVEFWNTWGDDVTVNAVFDEISLTSRGTPWASATGVLLSSFVVVVIVSFRAFRRR